MRTGSLTLSFALPSPLHCSFSTSSSVDVFDKSIGSSRFDLFLLIYGGLFGDEGTKGEADREGERNKGISEGEGQAGDEGKVSTTGTVSECECAAKFINKKK